MEYIPSSFAFCLLVGFGQWGASLEIRGRKESGTGASTSLFPLLWHASLSVSKGPALLKAAFSPQLSPPGFW